MIENINKFMFKLYYRFWSLFALNNKHFVKGLGNSIVVLVVMYQFYSKVRELAILWYILKWLLIRNY